MRSFTLDAVAARAGISKGGLVYSFATKDDLVHAALEREMARFQKAVRRRVGGGPTDAVELVLAHIEEALDEDDVSTQKAAFLVTALVHVRVLPHRNVLDCTLYSVATGDYEHVPCGMPLTRRDVVEANWCAHCAATINKAAQRRGQAEWVP